MITFFVFIQVKKLYMLDLKLMFFGPSVMKFSNITSHFLETKAIVTLVYSINRQHIYYYNDTGDLQRYRGIVYWPVPNYP